MDKVLLLIPQNREKNSEQGGQITAANGLVDYLQKNEFDYDIINTAPTNQEKKYKSLKIYAALKRVFNCYRLLKDRDKKYMIMFKSGMFSLGERYFMTLLCKKYDVKSSLFFRNSDILKVEFKSKSFKYKLLHNILDSFDVFFVQGNSWKVHLNKFLIDKNKIHVIPNWLPPGMDFGNELKVIKNNEKVKFIFTGRVVREKGVFEILEAAKLLNDYGSNFEIYILGDGLGKIRLDSMIKDYDLKNIYLLGWKNSEEVREMLSSSHIFLLPSYQEGFPNSILEAMACGLPIIATDVGAIRESVCDGVNGYIVNKKSSIELSSAMKRYLDNFSLISEHSKKSFEIVKKRHDRDMNCKYLFDILEKQ